MSSADVMMGEYAPRLSSNTDADPNSDVVYQDIDTERILANIMYTPAPGQQLSLDNLDFEGLGDGTDGDRERRRTAVGNLLIQLSPEQTRHIDYHSHPSISPIESSHPGSLPTPPASTEHPADVTEVCANTQTTRLPVMGPSVPATFQDSRVTSRARENIIVKREDSERAIPLALAKPGGAYAFAKMEFDDGHYYFNETEVEFGRDVRAMHAAEEKQKRRQEHSSADSSGRPQSRASEAQQRMAGSQVAGSVISEKGGFCGVDDDLPDGNEESLQRPNTNPSQGSSSSVVNPADLHTRPMPHFDYAENARANEAFEYGDDELPAQVTTAHLPKKSKLPPLIPIHAHARTIDEEIQSHKSISRRHINIRWDEKQSTWMLTIIGRNGAFLDEQFLPYEKSATLRDGAKIQVKQINMTFQLPTNVTASESEVSEESDQDSQPNLSRSSTPTSSQDHDPYVSTRKPRPPPREQLTAQSAPMDRITGQPLPPKKRGPGRPPKDGISSTRQKKEEEKRRRETEARAANGGITPPPGGRGKLSKPPPTVPASAAQQKSEKRKYTKKSKADEPMQSIEEGEVVDHDITDIAPPAKKPRKSKSLTPEYPAKESLTAEQLQKPPEPYAHQLYSLLSDYHPKELSLRQVYRAMKLRWPYYVYHTDTHGWQSSVRHNLNNHQGETFLKGKKEGKGFSWSARPGHPPKSESDKKRAAALNQTPKPPVNRPAQHRPPPVQWNGQPPQNGTPAQFAPPLGQNMYAPLNAQQWVANGHAHTQQSGPPNGQMGLGGQPSALQQQNGNNTGPYQPQQTMPQLAQPGQQNSRPPSAQSQTPASQQQVVAVPSPIHGLFQGQQPHQTLPQVPQSVPGVNNKGPSHCPCSLDGLDTIRKFENNLLEEAKCAADLTRMKAVFRSARDGALHGKSRPHAAPEELPADEKKKFYKEEEVVYNHLQDFIKAFPNVAFSGFALATTTS